VKLSDIVGNAGLSIYAQIALVIFFVTFVAIVWWVMHPSTRARWRRDSMMPLDDETPVEPRDTPEDR
jgi:cbb3-type cytochrome oxidase subunit 3